LNVIQIDPLSAARVDYNPRQMGDRVHFVRVLLGAVGLISVCQPSWALTVSVEEIDSATSYILVSGVFEPSDNLATFVQAAQRLGGKGSTVVFN
jgi:hypothetical protein